VPLGDGRVRLLAAPNAIQEILHVQAVEVDTAGADGVRCVRAFVPLYLFDLFVFLVEDRVIIASSDKFVF
jgi:hypothetical protein